MEINKFIQTEIYALSILKRYQTISKIQMEDIR